MEEVEKNFVTMRCMLSGDGEVEPNVEQVSQLALEISKEDVISLVVHKLPILGWEVSSILDIFTGVAHIRYSISMLM